MKKYINWLGLLSFCLGAVRFVIGCLSITLIHNVIISTLLITDGILLIVSSIALFAFPYDKYYQQEEINKIEWRYNEAVRKLEEATRYIQKEIVKQVIKESNERTKSII